MPITKEEALKALRTTVTIFLMAGQDPPALVIWPSAGGLLELSPVYSPENEGYSGRTAAMFRVGFDAARSGGLPPDVEYMLFSSMAWMLKADPANPLRGQIKDHQDRQEVLQVLVSAPDRVVEGWVYLVTREGGEVRLEEGKALGPGIVSPLAMAFWAGVPVGKVAAELAATARRGKGWSAKSSAEGEEFRQSGDYP